MAVVVDELIIRLIADGVEKAKKELLDAAKAAADAQKKLTNTEEKEAAKQAKIQEQKAKKAEAEAKKAAKAIEQAQKKAAASARQGTQEFFGALEKIDGFFTSIAVKAGLGIAALFGGAAAAVKSFVDEASELKTIASFTSLSTQEFQGLAYAMEQNGLSAEKLADGFRQFNAGFRESTLSGGKGAVAEGINDLGLSFEKMKNLRPQEQLFAILEAANKAGPSMGRAGVFARIFGEIAGANLSRIADQGVPAIKALIAEANDLGFVLSTESINAGVKVKQQFGQITATLSGLRNSIAIELLPVLSEFIPKIKDWIVQNRALIAQNVKTWLTELIAIGRQYTPWLKTALSLTIDLVKATKDWVPALTGAAAAIKAIIVAKDALTVVKGLAGAFTGAQTAVAFLAGPGGIAAIGLALAAAIPLAWEFGRALGSANAPAPTSLADRILASKFVRRGGGPQTLENQDQLAAEIAKLNDRDRRGLEAQIYGSQLGRDFRNKGVFGRLFGAADTQISDRETKAGQQEFAETLANELNKKAKSGRFLYSRQDLDSLVAMGQITAEQAQLALGTRSSRQFMNKRPDADKPVTDEELAKLIASATKSGANLDELLKGRKIAGGTPPVITLRLFEFKINAPITVNGQPGQSTPQLATAVADEFNNRLERELQKHTPAILEAR